MPSKIANKRSLLVIDALSGEPMRTGELRRRVDSVTRKMLTETLRELEELGLVARRSFETIPPHVEYRLTALGHSLCEAVCGLDRWIETNLYRMHAAEPKPSDCVAVGVATRGACDHGLR